MNQSNLGEPGDLKDAKLPRRDWFLLPVIGLLTICFILLSSEWVARNTFSTTGNVSQYCLTGDPSTGYRGMPNSTCTDKNSDTPLIDYKFNSAGYRGGMEFGPKSPGTYRIVMIGSSIAFGWYVPEEKSFAALLPAELTLETGRRVELYNEALPGGARGTPHNTVLRFNDVLAANPDMILWVLTSWDVANSVLEENTPQAQSQQTGKTGFPARVWNRIKEAKTRGSILDVTIDLWNSHSVSSMTKHFLYRSQSLYMEAYLMRTREEFLNAEPNAHWNERLKLFDSVAAELEGRAKVANVPFVAVYLPLRAPADMVSVGEWPRGYDPYRLDRELHTIITSHGGTYIDVLPGFRSISNPGQDYYVVDGHPNIEGHAIISKLLARELTSGAVSALKAAKLQQTAQELGR
jgi:hypothetical protein